MLGQTESPSPLVSSGPILWRMRNLPIFVKNPTRAFLAVSVAHTVPEMPWNLFAGAN